MLLEELISSFRFGNNKVRQLTEMLNEISLRDDKPIDEPLRSPEWLSIYNNPKIHIYQKGLWLQQYVGIYPFTSAWKAPLSGRIFLINYQPRSHT